MNRVGPDTVAVITGASGGVGRATARLFGELGAKLLLIARGRDGLEAAKSEVESAGGKAIIVPADVSDFEEMETAAEIAERDFGPIDVWINNAMVSMYSPFMEMTPEEFRHVVEVTFLGTVHGTRCALARMAPRDRGTIIQVGSALAFRSIPLQSAYCASKHAIQGFTEAIRSELIHQKSKVRVSLVNMPALNTTQFEWTKNKMRRKARPAGTIFQPEVAADAIRFAAEHDRREIMVGYTTVEATLGEKIAPGLLDRYLADAAWKGALLDEPADPNQPDNFWKPLAGDHGSHGPFDRMAHRFSPQLWATKHRGMLWGIAGVIGLGALLLGGRKMMENGAMKSKLLSNIAGRREWAIIFDTEDEAMAGLKEFAETEHLAAAHFTGIGAFADVTVAWFDLKRQSYQPIQIAEQVEVLSLIGDIAEFEGKPSVHAHICLAKRNGTAHGGHLQKGRVRPTLELIVIESPAHLRKSFRPEFGLPLIDLDRSSSEKS